MRAQRLEDDEATRFYEVTHGDRWWTVSITMDGGTLILNEKLRSVAPEGRLGRAILATIERL